MLCSLLRLEPCHEGWEPIRAPRKVRAAWKYPSSLKPAACWIAAMGNLSFPIETDFTKFEEMVTCGGLESMLSCFFLKKNVFCSPAVSLIGKKPHTAFKGALTSQFANQHKASISLLEGIIFQITISFSN